MERNKGLPWQTQTTGKEIHDCQSNTAENTQGNPKQRQKPKEKNKSYWENIQKEVKKTHLSKKKLQW